MMIIIIIYNCNTLQKGDNKDNNNNNNDNNNSYNYTLYHLPSLYSVSRTGIYWVLVLM